MRDMTGKDAIDVDATRPSSGARSVDDLVVECLERLEGGETSAVDRLAALYPAQASEIRRRIEALRSVGLIPEAGGDAVADHAHTGDEFPDRLGDFRLIERIGEGGMGVVFRAEQISLGREVALKMVRPDQLYFEKTKQRFLREVGVIARLEHPGIVPVHAVGDESGIPYFAMEKVAGCTLTAALDALAKRESKQRLTGRDLHDVVTRLTREANPNATFENEDVDGTTRTFFGAWDDVCLRIVGQVADALHHAHRRGVIHRDVKPSNIMLTPGGRVVLLDFGVSSSEGSAPITATFARLGTIAYMSPEQLEGEIEHVDERSDVYSLGATLYEMLTLQSAFRRATTEATARAVREGDVMPLRVRDRRISWEAEVVCLCAIDPDPDRRYATAADFRSDIEAALDRRPPMAKRSGLALRVRRWCQRHPARAVGIAAAFLFVVVGPIVFAVREKVARARVEDALREVSRQRRHAEDQRKKADDNLEQALAALDFMADLGDRRLTGFASLAPVRRELLEGVARFHQGLLDARRDDPTAQEDVVDARRRIGSLLRALGKTEEAGHHVREATVLARRLVAERPGDSRRELQLAKVLQVSAGLDVDGNRPREALSAWLELLPLYERHRSVSEEVKRDFVRGLHRTAVVARQAGKIDVAEKFGARALDVAEATWRRDSTRSSRFDLARALNAVLRIGKSPSADVMRGRARRALDITRALVRERPGRYDFAHELMISLENMANLQRRARLLHESVQAQREIVAEAARIARIFPRHSGLSLALPKGYLNLAIALRNIGEKHECDEFMDKATTAAEQNFERFPEVLAHRAMRGAVRCQRGMFIGEAQKPREALEHLERAIDDLDAVVASNPRHAQWGMYSFLAQRESARQNLILGDHESAAEHLRRAVRVMPPSGTHHRIVAGIWSTCAAIVARDEEFDEIDREELVVEYRREGLAILEQAVELGFANVKDLETAAVLKSLRTSAKFAAIVERARRNAATK